MTESRPEKRFLVSLVWIRSDKPLLRTRSSTFKILLNYAWGSRTLLSLALVGLPDIEKATLRLVAVHESRNRSSAAGAARDGPVSLSRWIERRKLPMHVVP